MWKISLVLLAIFLMSAIAAHNKRAYIDEMWKEGLEPFEEERFISPEVCGQCHIDIFDMWEGTMHFRAFDDPVFRAASKLFVRDSTHPGEREDAEHCVACHNPIAYRSGQIKGSSDDYEKTDEVTRWAISCDLCHSINEIVMIMNASFNTDPGEGEDEPGTKRGPRDDAESGYHETAFSTIHTSSEICGSCHNVTHLWYLTKLEGTYDEWYHSPYNSADPDEIVTCQDCHMRQSPGNPSTGMTDRPDYPGASAVMGGERPHIYRHSVTGGNAFVPAILGHHERAQLAVERLRHAAILEISIPEESGEEVSLFTVRVRNEGAGHMLPTGVSEFRQMWLEVTVKDGTGETVFSSGGIGIDGGLLPDTRIFRTVFGDPEGNPTINVTEAAVMLTDHRIPPKGWMDETFRLSTACKKPCTIRAELKYRSMDPEVVKLLMAGEEYEVPVVVMASSERTVK